MALSHFDDLSRNEPIGKRSVPESRVKPAVACETAGFRLIGWTLDADLLAARLADK